MAGFAVVMTILTYGVLALIVAAISSLALFFYSKRSIPETSPNRGRVIALSVATPFIALLWLVVALLIHVQISNRLAHQDCGLSADPYVTLPNGYVLGSHNTYDGYFKAPGFETDVPVAGPGYVRSIIDLQLSNGYFVGTLFDLKSSKVRSFKFDTRTRDYEVSDTTDPINTSIKSDLDKWGDSQTGVQQDANSYWKMYAHYRHLWPNYVLLFLILAGEGGILFGLTIMWKRKLEQTSHVLEDQLST